MSKLPLSLQETIPVLIAHGLEGESKRNLEVRATGSSDVRIYKLNGPYSNKGDLFRM
jgi:hypothetical protein